MTTPQVTSEEIAKAREFLREVRAVCRKHKMCITELSVALPLGDDEIGIRCEYVHLHGEGWLDIDLNEG